MGMEELPGQIAGQIQDAVEEERNNAAGDIERERINLERQRIRAEERMHERALESQEKIQGAFSFEELRDMFQSFASDLKSSIESLRSQSAPVIEVDASHEQEIPATNEDSENSDENSGEETPEQNPIEGVEEIGGDAAGDAESVVNDAEQTAEENVDAGNSKRGRKRRGRR